MVRVIKKIKVQEVGKSFHNFHFTFECFRRFVTSLYSSSFSDFLYSIFKRFILVFKSPILFLPFSTRFYEASSYLRIS